MSLSLKSNLSAPTTANEESAGQDSIAVRMVILVVPIVVTARLFSLLLPTPLAWAGSMFLWMLAIYWIPSRANIRLLRWLVMVLASTIATLLLAIFQPDMF